MLKILKIIASFCMRVHQNESFIDGLPLSDCSLISVVLPLEMFPSLTASHMQLSGPGIYIPEQKSVVSLTGRQGGVATGPDLHITEENSSGSVASLQNNDQTERAANITSESSEAHSNLSLLSDVNIPVEDHLLDALFFSKATDSNVWNTETGIQDVGVRICYGFIMNNI